MTVRCILLIMAVGSLLPAGASWAQNAATYPELKAQDWPWWRGPSHDGVVRVPMNVPTQWNANENIRWKTPIPGRGNGSPIVVGDQVILATCDENSGSQSLLSLSITDGKVLWQKTIHESGAMRKNAKSTGASSTPACDGQRLFINFANNQAVTTTALSLTGQVLWQTKITDYQIHQGYGSSPALYEDLVIVSADTKGGGAIAALRRDTGKLVWKRERPSAPNYPSPIILKIAGRNQMIMTGCDLVTSLDPLTGETIWEVAGATTECVTSTVTDGKLVFTSGGYPKNHMSAVAADGSKKVVWENNQRVYVPSLLIRDGYLFGVLDAGIAMCWEAATGEEMWKERLGGNFSASPVLVGDTIFATNETGETHLFKANPKSFVSVGKNKLGDECFATPTFSRNAIFLRIANIIDGKRSEELVCVGK